MPAEAKAELKTEAKVTPKVTKPPVTTIEDAPLVETPKIVVTSPQKMVGKPTIVAVPASTLAEMEAGRQALERHRRGG
jgi:hypothetical protein